MQALERGSPAWQNGLRQGDLIVSLNRRPLTAVADLEAIRTGDGQLLLNLQRGRSALFILIN